MSRRKQQPFPLSFKRDSPIWQLLGIPDSEIHKYCDENIMCDDHTTFPNAPLCKKRKFEETNLTILRNKLYNEYGFLVRVSANQTKKFKQDDLENKNNMNEYLEERDKIIEEIYKKIDEINKKFDEIEKSNQEFRKQFGPEEDPLQSNNKFQ